MEELLSKLNARLIRIFVIIFLCILLTFLLNAFVYFSFDLPSLDSLKNYNPPRVSEVYSEEGDVIGKFFSEERYVVPYNKIPKRVIEAFVSAEDANFFKHKGIDPKGILRAFFKNLAATKIKGGGSTITQQVARTFLLTRQKKISRKIKEIILANRIEKNLTKEQILYLFMNQTYLGHGSYGIQAASKNYFRKNINELTLAEIAMLAGLPQAPSLYSPYSAFDKAKARQKYVLEQMVKEGFISEEDATRAYNELLKIHPREDVNLENTPYATEEIRKYLYSKYGSDATLNGGLKIYTSIMTNVQKSANEAIKSGLIEVDKKRGYRGPVKIIPEDEVPSYILAQINDNPISALEKDKVYEAVVTDVNDEKKIISVAVGQYKGKIEFSDIGWWARGFNPEKFYKYEVITKPSQAVEKGFIIEVTPLSINKNAKKDLLFSLWQEPQVQGALLSISPETGYIRAMVGGYDFDKSEYNRALQAKRQVGSAIKPIVYAAALDKGFTPSTTIVDSPIIYDDPLNEGRWKPSNYEETFHGDVTFRSSLIHSYNVPTLKIARDIGLDYLINYAAKLGITTPLDRNLSIAIGSGSLSLAELVTAYGVFASKGKSIIPILIKSIKDYKGNTYEINSPKYESEDEEYNKKLEEYYTQYGRDELIEDEINTGEIQGKRPFIPKPLKPGYVVSPETSYLITHIMTEVIRFGTGTGVASLGRPCAGKTGTTDNFNDAWFIGYTPNLVTGVWTGLDDRTPLGTMFTGAEAAAPIWLRFMQKAVTHFEAKDFVVPKESIEFVKIDSKTGLLATSKTEKPVYEAFRKGTTPTKYAPEEGKKESVDEFFYMDSN